MHTGEKVDIRTEKGWRVYRNNMWVTPGLNGNAVWILAWVLSLGKDHHVTRQRIMNTLGLGEVAVDNALRRLRQAGLCHTFSPQRVDGTSEGKRLLFSPTKISREQATEIFFTLLPGKTITRETQVMDDGGSKIKITLEVTKESVNQTKSLKPSVECTDVGNNVVKEVPQEKDLPRPLDIGAAVIPSETGYGTAAAVAAPPHAVPGRAAASAPVRPAAACDPRQVAVAASNVQLLKGQHEPLAVAWRAKDILRWVGENCERGENGWWRTKSEYPLAEAGAALPGVQTLLDGFDINRASQKASDGDFVGVARGLDDNAQKVVSTWWDNLGPEGQKKFTHGCKLLSPTAELQAMFVARCVARNCGFPETQPYPSAVLFTVADIILPSPSWPVDKPVVERADAIWQAVWATRMRGDGPYRYRHATDPKRLACLLAYEMRGDVGRFKNLVASYLSREDDWLVRNRWTPNVLVKHWRRFEKAVTSG